MALILDMQKSRRQLAARKAFPPWKRRFGESFNGETRACDLSDTTLSFLITGEEQPIIALYDLVMGVKGMGQGTNFYLLGSARKLVVVDASLFLLDIMRFEAMARLEWIETYFGREMPLVELVEGLGTRFVSVPTTPVLSSTHPLYNDYVRQEYDRAALVRRLIPEALKAFEERAGHKPQN